MYLNRVAWILVFALVMVMPVFALEHTVKRGETLESIAIKYGVTVEAIKSANPTVNYIFSGIKLEIPQIVTEKDNYDEDEYRNEVVETTVNDGISVNYSKKQDSYGAKAGNNVFIDFVPSIYGVFSNFASSGTSPKGTMGFGVDMAFQFVAGDKIGFIPKNYYIEGSLGYSMRGSAAFPMHYLNLKISPIGYRYGIFDFVLFANLGAYIGYSPSGIQTYRYQFNTNIDTGISCKVGIEYGSLGLSVLYERGFPNVCDSNLPLKNQIIGVSLSYRLFNIK